jgi:hypothetical protein
LAVTYVAAVIRHFALASLAAIALSSTALSGTLATSPQQPPAAQSPAAANGIPADARERIATTEAATLDNLKAFRPVVEVYGQRVTEDASLVATPAQDMYLLGRFNWLDGPRLQELSGGLAAPRASIGASKGKDSAFDPDIFAATVVPDWRGLDPERYTFTLARREFLGRVRCLVFNVVPIQKREDGFVGRIWVEDRDFHIVRFNGINRGRAAPVVFSHAATFNVDSWRTNVLPGVWLPSYAYVEEGTAERSPDKPYARSHVRLWGYDPRTSMETGSLAFAGGAIDNAAAATPRAASVDASRQFEEEAEANIIERLAKANLLATPGAVEQVLNTVVNNLVITNNLQLTQPVSVRVLLTTPFDAFTVGHTLVLSRGLIDVLPDEASLALLLAHELAHVSLGHRLIDPQFAFGDRLMVGDDELLRLLPLKRTPADEAAADEKAIELLVNSPYRDKLAGAAAFLETVSRAAGPLANLIQPSVAQRFSAGGPLRQRLEERLAATGANASRSDAPAALPPGSRLILDPWSSRLFLVPDAAAVATDHRGPAPLVVAPLIPYLEYVTAPPLQYRP